MNKLTLLNGARDERILLHGWNLAQTKVAVGQQK